MGTDGNKRRTLGRVGGPLFLGVLLATFVLVSGCTYVPDAINPVEWYKSTTDFFTGDEDEIAMKPGEEPGELVAGRDTPPPGADQPFPNLASVPEGLVSDTQGRKYSSEEISRQGAPTQTLASAGQAVTAPAPPPVPVAAVTPAPIPVPAAPPPVPASAPSLVELTPPLPPALQETYQAGLAQQLPAGPATVSPLSNLPLPAGPDQLATVVISSEGVEVMGIPVEMADVSSAIPPMSLPASPGQLPVMAQSPAPSMPAPAALVPASRSGLLKVATIMFPNGSAHLNAHDRRILADVFQLYRQSGGTVRVVGHASSRTRNMDTIRHKMVNYRISITRADVVVAELIRLGIRPGEIVVDAKSDSMPLYYEFMPSGEAGNRRTEIYLEG